MIYVGTCYVGIYLDKLGRTFCNLSTPLMWVVSDLPLRAPASEMSIPQKCKFFHQTQISINGTKRGFPP